jgi:hypothetical protein
VRDRVQPFFRHGLLPTDITRKDRQDWAA